MTYRQVSGERPRRLAKGARGSDREIARGGSPVEREAYVHRRREADAEGHDRRRTLARELAAHVPLRIDPEVGFLRAQPGDVPGTDAVVAAALRLIEAVGKEALLRDRKKPMAKGFLPAGDLTLESPYLRLALGDEVVSIVSDYLGMIPVLTYVDVWYSPHEEKPPRSSQLFHLDNADVRQVKLFLHCEDVLAASGPLTVLDASTSRRLANQIGYRLSQTRVDDETVERTLGGARWVALEGSAGAAAFVDTSRCFHFGSRVEAGAAPRKLVVFQYLTPYAFDFESDHRDEAPFRGLVSESSSERERLVLGAD